jgi:cell division protein FtsI (penicillin-binding protein 3)
MKNLKFNVLIVYIVILVLGIMAIYRIVSLNIAKGKYYKGEIPLNEEVMIDGRTFKMETSSITGKRGNILSDDGTILLSTVYVYDLYWYPSYIEAKDDSLFMANVDSLIHIFRKLNPKYSLDYYNKNIKEEYLNYKTEFQLARDKVKSKDENLQKEGRATLNALRKRYKKIKITNVSNKNEWVCQKDINKIDSLFAGWKGDDRYRGGCKKDQRTVRRQLMGGYPKSVLGGFESVTSSKGLDSLVFHKGIEGYYNDSLQGKTVPYRILKVNNATVRLKENKYLAANNGCDVVTTIDNDIQRVTKNALEKSILEHSATWGCAIVMEVKTGEIKAICNLDRTGNKCEERADHATTEVYEPGSTFKLMSLLAALESGKVDTGTIVKCERGDFSVKRAFAISDNNGIFEATKKGYDNVYGFLYALMKMSLRDDLHIQTAQAKTPDTARNLNKGDYKNLTFGYGIKVPPVYMLAYYNAVANNGKYVRPTLVRSINCPNGGRTDIAFSEDNVINPAIASPKTIAKVKNCLETVVTSGTARRARDYQYLQNIRSKDTSQIYHPLIAGKTGTAFLYDAVARKYSKLKNSSFIGYFPSQEPKYTCLVLVTGTTLDASIVSVPVCLEIAEKLTANDMEIFLSESKEGVKKNAPTCPFAYADDIQKIYKGLNIHLNENQKNGFVAVVKNTDDEIKLTEKEIQNNSFSQLRNATAKDAAYILEKMGYAVSFNGRGKVKSVQTDGKKAVVNLSN